MDKDAKVWTEDGVPMFCIKRDKQRFPSADAVNKWCDKHLEGRFVCTPTYICFEHEVESTYFGVGFNA